MKVDQRTVSKAWNKGWPAIGLEPISRLVEFTSSSDSGAASKPVTPEQVVGPKTAPRQNLLSEPTDDEYLAALARLEDARVRAMIKELEIIETIQHNTLGIQVISTKLLAEIQARVPTVLSKLDIDLDVDMKHSVARLCNLLEVTVKAIKDSSACFAQSQESHRLLVGAPQRITETKHTGGSGNPDDIEEQAAADKELARLVYAASRRQRSSAGYVGEESGFVEVDSTPARKEIPAADGNAAAKQSEVTGKAA